MNSLLNKLVAVAILTFGTYAEAASQVCMANQLKVEVSKVYPNGLIKVHLTGHIDAPSPGFNYTFEIIPANGAYTAAIDIQDAPSLNIGVITPMVVEEVFWLPATMVKLHIDVSKSFNWGPEYFLIPLALNNTKCTNGDQYK